MDTIRILIVDDEPAHVAAIRRALEADGAHTHVMEAGTLREFHESVAAAMPDIALMDLNLPDGRAVEILHAPPEAGPFPILIMTSYGNEQTAVEALKSGALDYVVKSPEAFATMSRTVARTLREWKLLQESKNLEHQLRQSQKMEAIGTLAGGIAHDFNNILTAIVGYSTLLQMDLKLSGRPQEYVDNLMALVERATHLTSGLLAFSRSQVMTPRKIDLNGVVTTIIKLASRLIGEGITVETRLFPRSLSIMADCGQIEQVLMNLATNARDAMPDGGKLVISTDLVNLEPEHHLLTDTNPPGAYVLLSVTDTGTGMDDATAARIFEPFFTTKETGKGTGLGLSILYGIIKQHGGMVTVSSKPGHGTTFTIHLPLAAEAAAGTFDKEYAPAAGGTETLLIAEDDPAIRRVISHVLRQFGHRVLEAADGEEAVEMFRSNAATISLVILDMIMPRKNGNEAYEAITEIAPGMHVLFLSGYPADLIAQKALLPPGAAFLQKPVSPMELLRNIRQVLDGRGERADG